MNQNHNPKIQEMFTSKNSSSPIKKNMNLLNKNSSNSKTKIKSKKNKS